nr:hypothetical protein [Macrococcus goetzii]
MKLILKLIAYLSVTMFIIFNATDDVLKMEYCFYFTMLGVFVIASADLIKREELKERN